MWDGNGFKPICKQYLGINSYQSKLNEEGKNKVSLIQVPLHSGIKEKEETNKLTRRVPNATHWSRNESFLRDFKNAKSKRCLAHSKNKLHLLTGHCRLRKSLIRVLLSDTGECDSVERRRLFTWSRITPPLQAKLGNALVQSTL